ncbi:MAG: protein kinase, partial [Myxococcales bacterium]|nr:protein kinase [Myxococcales bacterium]
LSHPNTIQFFDFGEMENGTLFIVMEYIEGESLADMLLRGPLDADRVDRLLIQICGSLNEAHQLGVIHRDLKPDNILFTNRGGQSDFVKVLDFGIAKRSEAEDERSTRLTKQGMVLGTPPYMSPEQFSGTVLDPRSDIYSLGLITYEMLTGTLPFAAKTPWEWATKHLTAEPDPIERHPTGEQLPPHKRGAVMKALMKNRDDRQSGVLEFMRDFTAVTDPSSAWAMVTSPSGTFSPREIMAASATAPAPTGARPAVGTPEPMPETGESSIWTTSQVRAASKARLGLLFAAFILGGAGIGALIWSMSSPSGTDGTKMASVAAPVDAPTTEDTTPDPVAPGASPAEDNGKKANELEQPDEATPADPKGGDPKPKAEEDKDPTPAAPKAKPSRRTSSPTKVAKPPEPDPTPAATPDPPKPKPFVPRTPPPPPDPADSNIDALERQGLEAIQQGDFPAAIKAISSIRKKQGVSASKSLQRALAKKAYRKIGALIIAGDCGGAQKLYQDLRRVDSHDASTKQFSAACPAP